MRVSRLLGAVLGLLRLHLSEQYFTSVALALEVLALRWPMGSQ